MKEKVILAYSGGLDTSIIIPWLKEHYDLEIVAACIDVGQNEDLEDIKNRAFESGASRVYVEDVREEFVTGYIYPVLKAGAVYEGKYLLGTSFARPLIAKKLVEIAHAEDARIICHGCTGKGNDQVRFEISIAALDPTIKIIAPWRIWDIKSREDAIDYAEKKGIQVPVTKEKIYSRDHNLWHVSHEGGELEDLRNEHNAGMYLHVTPPEQVPDAVNYVTIEFAQGVPVAVDGQTLTPVELLQKLNGIGEANGIGIIDLTENRLVGMKSRGVYETPGGTLLFQAHSELEHAVLDRFTYHYKELVALKYAELVYDGLWFTTLREAIDAFVDQTQKTVTGTVRLKLYKGSMMVAGVDSPYALYDKGISSFGDSELYNHKDSEGFINLFGLPVKIKALMEKGLIQRVG